MKALLSREAQKQLDRLNDPTATRISDGIEGLEREPPGGDDTLSDDEMKLLEQCRKDWKEKPESFISIAEYRKHRGISGDR